MQEDGTFESESKKQASRLKREMKKIKSNLEGVRNMARLPGAIVVVDAKKEYLALREAQKLGVTTVGIIDTDSDPDTVDVAIPANDDSIRAVELILNELAEAVAIGKTMVTARQEPVVRGRRPRPRRAPMARAGEGESQTVAAAEQGSPESGQFGPQEEDAQEQQPTEPSPS
jgi:small subunit ribosomal protein S2